MAWDRRMHWRKERRILKGGREEWRNEGKDSE
jgi:hypothetical protein